MRRLLTSLMLFSLFIFCFASCSDDDIQPVPAMLQLKQIIANLKETPDNSKFTEQLENVLIADAAINNLTVFVLNNASIGQNSFDVLLYVVKAKYAPTDLKNETELTTLKGDKLIVKVLDSKVYVNGVELDLNKHTVVGDNSVYILDQLLPQTPPEPKYLLTKVIITGGDDIVTTDFFYDENNDIIGYTSKGTNHNFGAKLYYSNGLITGMSTYGVEGVDSSRIERNNDGKMEKLYTYQADNDFKEPIEIVGFKWTGEKIVEVKDIKDNETYPLIYVNGNITSLKFRGTYTAEFDDKKNPYSLIQGLLLSFYGNLPNFIRFPEDDDVISILNNNNITKSELILGNNCSITNYTYEYNDEGFVTKKIEKRNNMDSPIVYTSTYEFFYEWRF